MGNTTITINEFQRDVLIAFITPRYCKEHYEVWADETTNKNGARECDKKLLVAIEDILRMLNVDPEDVLRGTVVATKS